jgi:HAD superfamily hydrolase (TIGR01509 family)
MAGNHRIKLVCFDLGGVVVRICHTWAEGCAAAGLDVRAELPASMEMAAAWSYIGAAYQCGRITGEQFAHKLSDAMDGLYTPAEVRAINDAWIIDDYDGIGELIDELHALDYDTGVLSNTSHEHWENRLQTEVIRRTTHRVASHLVGVMKPSSAIYEAMQNACGYAGGQIIFFDDLPENIEGARAMGWHAHRIDPQGDPAAQIRTHLAAHGVLNGSVV